MVNNGSLLRIICKFSLCLLFLFRRLLQMGVFNCQLYNNLGLCCFYAQQYDMTLSSFERALALVSSDEEQADIWYNLGHVAVVSRHSKPSVTCVRVCRWERAWPLTAGTNSHISVHSKVIWSDKWFRDLVSLTKSDQTGGRFILISLYNPLKRTSFCKPNIYWSMESQVCFSYNPCWQTSGKNMFF